MISNFCLQYAAQYNTNSGTFLLINLASWDAFHLWSPFIYCQPQSTVIFPQGSTSIQGYSPTHGRLPLRVFLQPRSSSIQGRLPSKVISNQRLSSSKVVFLQGCLPPRLSSSKAVFHQRMSFIQECSQFQVVFHPRLSSIQGQGCLPPKVITKQKTTKHKAQRNIKHNTTQNKIQNTKTYHKTIQNTKYKIQNNRNCKRQQSTKYKT